MRPKSGLKFNAISEKLWNDRLITTSSFDLNFKLQLATKKMVPFKWR